jgi:hypothetical protein
MDAPALEDDWVPDPFGVQVLSPAHLSRVRLDASWNIQTMADGKKLVSARQLQAWFDVGRPLESTLASAREQFRPILLTTELAVSAARRE